MTSRKPVDPVKYINELSLGHPNAQAISRLMLVEMRRRGIKLTEATRTQFVALHDHAVETFNRVNRPKTRPAAEWRTARKRRGYPPRH